MTTDSEGRELKRMHLGPYIFRVVNHDPGKSKDQKATTRKVKR